MQFDVGNLRLIDLIFQVIRTSEDAFRDFLFQQLGGLIR